MAYKQIAKTIPGFMSLALVGESIKLVPKFKKGKIKPVKSKKLVKGFTNLIVGTSLIKPVADITLAL